MALLTWKKFNMAAIQCEIKYFSENIFYNDKRKENIYSFKIISSINEIFYELRCRHIRFFGQIIIE